MLDTWVYRVVSYWAPNLNGRVGWAGCLASQHQTKPTGESKGLGGFWLEGRMD